VSSVGACALVTATLVLALQPAAAASGDITTVAGTGMSGVVGDGGPAITAQLSFPFGVVADAAGNIFIGDHNNSRIRRVDAATGFITTVVGTTRGFGGDGGPARAAQIDGPVGLDLDDDGNIFIADFNNHRIRRVDAATQVITTVAGTGVPTYNGDGIAATQAALSFPYDVDLDDDGNLFIADLSNSRIRRVDAASQVITTVAGTGERNFGGDGGPAVAAMLNQPQGVTVDGQGNLFIADTQNDRIRRVDAASQVITTIETPDAQLLEPGDTTLDDQGNLFIADTGFNRVLRVAAGTGTLSLVAGTGERGDSGDGGPAGEAKLNLPYDVDVTPFGDLLISDTYNHRIRLVDDVALPASSPTSSTVPTSTSTTVPSTSTTVPSTSTTVPSTSTTVPSTSTTVPSTSTTVPATSTTVPSTSTTVPSTSSTVPSTSTTVPSTSTTVPSTSTTVPAAEEPTIVGTEGDDTIMGTPGDDVIDGRGGDDFIIGGGGNDTIFGGDGNDSISGDAGDDRLFGGAGNDQLRGGAGTDTSEGGEGDDRLTDGDGDDELLGGLGADILRGGTGNDDLDGAAGDDRLLGEQGNDRLNGGDGNDRLNGGDGTDACDGGTGQDGQANNCEGAAVG
jgi:Ca2+-binding RTX toxin-like protein